MAAKFPKPRLWHVLVALVVVAALVLGVMLAWPYLATFSDPDEARAFIQSAGPLAPLVFIGLQMLQVFIAPIPGQVTGLVGGYLFGTFFGTLYTVIGATIGFTLIFLLARRLGRPFVERFVDKKHLEKFDYLAETRGTLVLFAIFLLPALPDDIICFIAGLTKIRIPVLILISVLGRLPGFLVLSLTGSGVAEGNVRLVATIAAIAAALGLIAFWQRARIERFVHRLSKKDGQDKEK